MLPFPRRPKKNLVVSFDEIIVTNFNLSSEGMFKNLKELYKRYKPYVRVDLVMYGSLILMIILYFIINSILG